MKKKRKYHKRTSDLRELLAVFREGLIGILQVAHETRWKDR